jgi:hypothetical protein
MLKQFLTEVETVSRDLRTGKRFPKYRPSEPMAANEKKVGIITDWWRKALYISFRMRCDSIDQLMSAPGAQMDAEQRNRLADQKSTLAAIVFGDLRSIFGQGVIGVRKNWMVVAMAAAPKPTAKKKSERRKMLAPKDHLPGNFSTYGNPDCKKCPVGPTVPLPPRPHDDHVIT